MMGKKEEYLTALIRKERGHKHFWWVIRKFGAKRPWTITEVHRRSRANRKTVSDFVYRLLRAGLIETTGSARNVGGKTERFYQLITDRPDCPRLKRDGTECPEKSTDTMWRTMKMLKHFTPAEVAVAASATKPVKHSTAYSYIKRLNYAGVLVLVADRQPNQEPRYRLVRNLGAEAPQILRTKHVYDPNANQIVGVAVAEEVTP